MEQERCGARDHNRNRQHEEKALIALHFNSKKCEVTQNRSAGCTNGK